MASVLNEETPVDRFDEEEEKIVEKPASAPRYTVSGEEPRPKAASETGAGAVIGKTARINGTIHLEEDLEILGDVTGDVSGAGRIRIHGRVNGKVHAGALIVESGSVEGDVTSASSVVVGRDGRLKGDVTAESLQLSGYVEGNISLSGSAELTETARLVGDLTAETISAKTGAKLCGKVAVGERAQSPQSEAAADSTPQEGPSADPETATV